MCARLDGTVGRKHGNLKYLRHPPLHLRVYRLFAIPSTRDVFLSHLCLFSPFFLPRHAVISCFSRINCQRDVRRAATAWIDPGITDKRRRRVIARGSHMFESCNFYVRKVIFAPGGSRIKQISCSLSLCRPVSLAVPRANMT